LPGSRVILDTRDGPWPESRLGDLIPNFQRHNFHEEALGKAGFIAYQQSRVISAAACACTYFYFALSLFLFANSWDQMGKIFKALG
jgi:hypothetical protein